MPTGNLPETQSTPVLWLQKRTLADDFPPVADTLPNTNGLLACGGNLSCERLLVAYRCGIFPWYDSDPILWWSPPQRCVLYPDKLYLSHSLRKKLRQKRYIITVNEHFAEVIRACACHRGDKTDTDNTTWLTPAMQQAYCRLHHQGHAHSVEVWMEGELVGGLYGVVSSLVFSGESMFSRVADASKIALAYLAYSLLQSDYILIDCQISSPHLHSLGAIEIPRERFIKILKETKDLSLPLQWTGNENWGEDLINGKNTDTIRDRVHKG